MVTENYSDDMAYTMPNVDRAYAQAHAALREAPWLNDSGYAHPIATPASAPQNPLDNIADLEVLQGMCGMMINTLEELRRDVAGTAAEQDVNVAIRALSDALKSNNPGNVRNALNVAAGVAVSTKSSGSTLEQNYKHDEMNELLAKLDQHDMNIRGKVDKAMDKYGDKEERDAIEALRKQVDDAKEALRLAEEAGDLERAKEAKEKLRLTYEHMFAEQPAILERLKDRAERSGDTETVKEMEEAIAESKQAAAKKKELKEAIAEHQQSAADIQTAADIQAAADIQVSKPETTINLSFNENRAEDINLSTAPTELPTLQQAKTVTNSAIKVDITTINNDDLFSLSPSIGGSQPSGPDRQRS